MCTAESLTAGNAEVYSTCVNWDAYCCMLTVDCCTQYEMTEYIGLCGEILQFQGFSILLFNQHGYLIIGTQ